MEQNKNVNNVNAPNRPLPPKLPPKMPTNLKPQPQTQTPPPQPKQKSIDELLARSDSRSYAMPEEEVVDKVIHKNDKQIIKDYISKVSAGKRAIKKAKQRLLFNTTPCKSVKNVFAEDIPEMLWFYPHRKMRSIMNKFATGITLTTAPNHKGIIAAIIIIFLIIAIIASGIYIAFILTRNLNPDDSKVVGEIVFNWEDTQSGKASTSTSLNIDYARLNKDIEVSPAVTNNTNTDLYLRFYIKLDYLLGKDYWGVDINDLTTSCTIDSEKWWLDSDANVVYYLDVLHPKEKMFVFHAFQINGDPSIEGAWSGKSVNAIIQVEVCQKISDDQEFPPSWNMTWYSMLTNN